SSENLPIINRTSTVLGCTLTFLIIAWLAVFLRLYVRLKITKSPGWDDLVVAFAISSATAGSVIVCLQPGAGMGQHLSTLPLDKIELYFSYVYAANVTYTSSTTLIKIAILLQYHRVFENASKLAQRITIALIVIVACWGISFFFVAVFSCNPIALNWNLSLQGHCVMFGSKNPAKLFAAFAGHAASNMFLDIVILLTPVPFLRTLRFTGKTKAGIIALFSIGGLVALFSVVRLFSLAINRAGTSPVFDVTWYAPPIFIFSSLEIEVAILCASIPIFWPVISQLSFGKILVVSEIEVRSEARESDMELGRRPSQASDAGL
ncbi:hypothetical protein K432DRAFT_247611, partial [Lepidopterella palustris CBS 459.81]